MVLKFYVLDSIRAPHKTYAYQILSQNMSVPDIKNLGLVTLGLALVQLWKFWYLLTGVQVEQVPWLVIGVLKVC